MLVLLQLVLAIASNSEKICPCHLNIDKILYVILIQKVINGLGHNKNTKNSFCGTVATHDMIHAHIHVLKWFYSCLYLSVDP